MSEKKKIVTHSSGFHADDVFAVAALILLYGEENVEIIRSREKEIIESGDIVLDTGMEYDPKKNRFDHHQEGGAGIRENGIPYASFGLIWKHFGADLCGGNAEVAQYVEDKIVQPVDAHDNGVPIYLPGTYGIKPFLMDDLMQSLYPSREEGDAYMDQQFAVAVGIAQIIIKRLVHYGQQVVGDEEALQKLYSEAKDKRVLILDVRRSWRKFVPEHFPNVAFVVYPRIVDEKGETWSVFAVQENYPYSVDMRVALPEAWAGKEGEELESVTGVAGAIFCHRGRHMCVAKTKEAALVLVHKALELAEAH